MNVIITCEHGGNNIPREYISLFEDDISILQTHKAYDPGAFELAKAISGKTDYFFFSEISPLYSLIISSDGFLKTIPEFPSRIR